MPTISKKKSVKPVEKTTETKPVEPVIETKEDPSVAELKERITKLEKILDQSTETEEIKPSKHQDPLDHIVSCPNCATNLKKRYEEREKSRVACDNCNARVLETDKFCINCGESLE